METTADIRAGHAYHADTLRHAVACIVAACHPASVIFFGSRCRDQGGPDSDVDLLVVHPDLDKPGADRFAIYARIMDALLPFDFPVDVILASPHEFDAWKDYPSHVIGAAHQGGQVMYGSP